MERLIQIHFKDINPLLSIRRGATGLEFPVPVDCGGFLYSRDYDV